MCCDILYRISCHLGYKFRLMVAVINAAFGTGFLIYSTYVVNNVQHLGEDWMNRTFANSHGWYPSEQDVSFLWATVVAAKDAGKIVGVFLIPFIAERIGRKRGILLNDVITITGSYLCFIGLYSPYYVIMIGRVLLGLSLVIGAGLGSLFICEISPIEYRGTTGAFIQIFRALGAFLGPLLTLPEIMGTPDLWTLALAVPAIPASIDFMFLMWVMESPRYMFLTADKPFEAAESIEFYQGSERVDRVLEELTLEKLHIQSKEKMSFWEKLSNREYLKPLLLAALALSNRSIAGAIVLESYSTDIFTRSGFETRIAAYSTVILGACQLISALSVTFTVEQCGRRAMLIGSNLGCILCLISMSICAAFANESPLAGNFLLVSAIFYMMLYPIYGSVGNIVASELCHQEIRSLAFTIGLLFYSSIGLASTYVYPFLKHTLGFAWSFTPFIIMLIFTTAAYFVWLPETSGVAFHNAGSAGSNLNTKENLDKKDATKGIDKMNDNKKRKKKSSDEED